MGNSGEYIDRLNARLKDMEREISEISELADKALLEVKTDYRQQINDLFLKRTYVQDKVNKIQRGGGDAWEDMKAGTELSWEAFDESVKSRIKNIK